jgi:hypothetical protein
MNKQARNEVPWWRNHVWFGRHVFAENRNKNCHLLLQYDGMTVAWFPDGSGIRDADTDMMALRKRISDAGENPSMFCYEYFSTMPCIPFVEEMMK